MTRYRRVAGLILLLFLTSRAMAQGNGDGSIYSRFGLGELRTYASPQMQGMGSLGLALGSSQYANMANPASWSDQYFTRLAAGLLYEGLTATDANQNQTRLTAGSLNAIHASFPLKSGKMGVAFALTPYSRVNYQVEVEDQLIDPFLGDTTGYTIAFEGGGGLQQLTGGLGYRFNRYISAGAAFNFLFGIQEETQRTVFDGSDYQSSNLVTSTRMEGFGGTVGVRVQLPQIFRTSDALSLGVLLSLPVTLDGTRVRTLGENLATDTLAQAIEGTVELPLRAGLGLAYQPDTRLLVVADALYEPWSDFESSLSFPGYVAGSAATFQDRRRFSAGVEYFPAGRDPLAGYLRLIAWRLGVAYDATYASPNPDVPIRSLSLATGVSLPTRIATSRIDLNFEIGTRGTTDDGLIRDRFYRIGANLNFGERWFTKTRLR